MTVMSVGRGRAWSFLRGALPTSLGPTLLWKWTQEPGRGDPEDTWTPESKGRTGTPPPYLSPGPPFLGYHPQTCKHKESGNVQSQCVWECAEWDGPSMPMRSSTYQQR